MQNQCDFRIRKVAISPDFSLSRQGISASNNNSNTKLSSRKAGNSPSQKDLSLNVTSQLNPQQVVYVEICGIKKIKHLIDFDSPHTKNAAKMLGLTINECLKRYFYLNNKIIETKQIFLYLV